MKVLAIRYKGVVNLSQHIMAILELSCWWEEKEEEKERKIKHFLGSRLEDRNVTLEMSREHYKGVEN